MSSVRRPKLPTTFIHLSTEKLETKEMKKTNEEIKGEEIDDILKLISILFPKSFTIFLS